MTVNSVSQSTLNTSRMLSLRSQLDVLQQQLGTGQRADNYADLGQTRSTSLNIRGQQAELEGFTSAIQRTGVTFSILSQTLERLDALADDMKGDAIPTSFVIQNGDQTVAQVAAEHRLYEAVTLLNTDIDGQFLFSGLSNDVEPVVPAGDILNGVGAKAGFTQVMAERAEADLGGSLSDPALTGRLDLATLGTSTSITEAGNDVFGFQLDTTAGASSSSANIAVTGPAGAPNALSFDVTGTVDIGETIRFTLEMPDGSKSDIILSAVNDLQGNENGFIPDVDPAVTAARIGNAVASVIDGVARRDLVAASAQQAGHDFFDNNPPLRVVPDALNGIAGATSTVGDDVNTIVWYQGEDGPLDARLTATTRVDDGVQVAYGARANEDALRTTIREMAVFASHVFDVDDPAAADRYTEIAVRSRQALDDPSGGNLPRSIALEVGTSSTLMEATRERHRATNGIFNDILAGTDGITEEEVAAKLLNIKTRLETTYTVTSILSDLSLVNYMR